MKKTLLLLLGISAAVLGMAQTETKTKTDWSKIDISSRSADHLMLQFGSDSWTGRPDSVRTGGFSRHFNFYFMFDKPFKSNPKFSVGLGVGIGASNMFFKNTKVDVRSNTAKLPFTNVDSADHFKKFKLTTMYLEAPVELRYYANPANPNKSWKAALGVKIGTLLKAYTKGKDLVTKNGASIYGTSYIEKESSKRFINGTMLAATARVGYGILSLDAGYQITGVLKDGAGADMHKFSIGITISGL
ncbi:outer membrane beta-barrel protein [Sediminibacterium ginsengisoli]|uniref:Outer membrane protein beta-barrel domain-containing protein n=1 Tax=Sediminibacterium ginsengisoli TaxID=413434 RepID=A0A1T4MM17_9BACT|nr:outer membrane beta-barrel protein [Sediminibacterium ginsengisoli]SJZ67835.1 Outer membrane protein beta-barrel domain-containing protein [Sediminibacterium ginsengisoli]